MVTDLDIYVHFYEHVSLKTLMGISTIFEREL